MKKYCEYFMNKLFLIKKSELSKDIINPNYIDSNGNGIYHYFSEYSIEKFYKLNYKEKEKNLLIDEKKYEKIIEEYKKEINIYLDLLDELKFDKFLVNKQNQTPLTYSIIHKNYYIAKEYIKRMINMDILTEKDFQEIFNLLINSGNCLREDCIQLILYILNITKEKRIKAFNNKFLNKQDIKNGFTPILLICQDFSNNIYEKFNQIISMKTSNYYDFFKNNENIKKYKEESALAEILLQSKQYLDTFISQSFFPLLNNLINLGSDINYIEKNKKQTLPKSAFIYLMSYPFFENISLFIEQNKININYQDEKGKTALMYLIDNRDKIISISKDIFDKVFTFFINNNELEIEKTNKIGLTAFGLCLMRKYYKEAKLIYMSKRAQYKDLFYYEILAFIFNYIGQSKGYLQILKFFEMFENTYYMKYNYIDNIFNRTLLHYICLYSPKNNDKFYIFKEIYLNLIEYRINACKIDIYHRNALFYLFIDENEKIKINDPFLKLRLCLKNSVFNNLNDFDIYGKNLLFYAVQAKSYKSIKILIDFGVSLDNTYIDGNTIYSIASIMGDFDLFIFLYNLKKDNQVFLHKVYSLDQFQLEKTSENDVVQILIDIYKELNEPLPKKQIFKEYLEIKYEGDYIIKNDYIDENKIKSEFKSNYINVNSRENIDILDDLTQIIQIGNNEETKNSLFNYEQIYIFFQNIYKIKCKKRENMKEKGKKMLAESLFQYCKSNKYENFCRFMINENYHFLSICKDLLALKYEDELNKYIFYAFLEKDLLNYKNEEDITIFHILSKIKNNLSFYKENSLEKYNISNIFDKKGNTPIYYACQNLNENFIEIFSNYSFSLIDNDPNKVKYFLFNETNNKTSPLKSLYFQIDKKDMKILKLIIDISINTKKVYILSIIYFLIKNYTPINNDIFKLPYHQNLNKEDYIIKIIGLYSFYTQELKGSFTNNDFQGINPIFYCVKFNNYEFLFNVLLKENNFEINSRNKEGKNLIHLIVDLKENQNENSWNKKDILNKCLEAGFDFNIKDNNGMLPIDYAYLNKDSEIINVLIDKYNKCRIAVPKDKNEIIEEEEEEEQENPNVFFY